MRRIIILAALACACVGFVPATASAANCSASITHTWWDGLLNFAGYVGACTADVSMVEFVGANAAWSDDTALVTKWATSTLGPAVPSGSIWGANSVSRTYRRPSWCGGATHQVHTWFQYRIRNASQSYPGTWGSWYYKYSDQYAIWC